MGFCAVREGTDNVLLEINKMLTFFKPPFLYLLHKAECLIFG